jgi:HlyD family secretion protein
MKREGAVLRKQTLSRWWQRVPYAITAAVIGALLVYAFTPNPVLVEVASAERGALQVSVDEDGFTRAHDRYVITAPVSGRMARIELHDGDAIARDQRITQIWPLPLSAREREEAMARLAAAQALEREAGQRVTHSKADYDQARRERQRVERLVANGFVSPQAVEQARVTETTSANELEAARFRAQSAAADVLTARAGLLAIEGAGREPTASVPVVSPVQGRVLRISDASERVVSAGAPLLTLGDATKLEVVLDVLSTEAVKVKPDMPVILEGWGGDNPLRAKVRVVEPYAFTKISALGVEEQRVNVIADFVDAPTELGDGYRVDARIIVWSADSVLQLPTSALFRHGERWAVFVVENRRAQRRMVEVGQRNALNARILGGLETGARVIRHPSNDIEEGTRVVWRSQLERQ